MRTGLTKQEKTTDIWFDEKDPLIHIRTHNTALKKRLLAWTLMSLSVFFSQPNSFSKDSLAGSCRKLSKALVVKSGYSRVICTLLRIFSMLDNLLVLHSPCVMISWLS